MNANSTNRTTCPAISALLALAALLWLPALAGAGQYSLFGGDVVSVTKTTVAFGVAFRNGNADCQLIGAGAGQGDDPEFPCASGAVAVNDDPNINFKKGDALSAPITVVSDFTFRHKSGTGVFFRLRGWYDTVLDNKKMPHGTTSTAFVPDTKMDDSGYIGAQKFKGFELYDAFFFGNYKLDKSTLTLRVGRQAIDWGESLLYPGVNGIQAYDFAWATMPGAPTIDGAKLPVNRVVVSLAGGEGWTVDGFMNLEFRESVLPGCGTWNSYNDQGPAPGCNLAAAGGFPDRFSALVLKNRSYYEGRLFAGGAFPEGGIATAAGTYREPSQWSGYGMAVHKFANALNTDFGFYYANYTNPILNISPLVGTDALTFAVNTHFVPDVQMLGVSTSTGARNIAMFGQLLYTLDYPAQRNAPTFIQGSTQGLGPYGWMQSHVNEQVPAFFEMDVAQLQLGGTWQFGERIGLTDATLTGEVNGQWATNHPGLDGPNAERLGRSGNFGTAAWDQQGYVCDPNQLANGIINRCEVKGFATEYAVGFKLRAAANLPQPSLGITWTPVLTLQDDVYGFSTDGAVREGRLVLGAYLRASLREKYYFEGGLILPNRGAEWDDASDRGQYSMVFGMTL